MDTLMHAQFAILAKFNIRARLVPIDKRPLAQSLQMAAWDCFEKSRDITAKAFIEGAVDLGVKASSAQAAFYRARAQFDDAPEFK